MTAIQNIRARGASGPGVSQQAEVKLAGKDLIGFLQRLHDKSATGVCLDMASLAGQIRYPDNPDTYSIQLKSEPGVDGSLSFFGAPHTFGNALQAADAKGLAQRELAAKLLELSKNGYLVESFAVMNANANDTKTVAGTSIWQDAVFYHVTARMQQPGEEILQLVSNAYDFTKQGQPSSRLRPRAFYPVDNMIVYEGGMPDASEHEQLFLKSIAADIAARASAELARQKKSARADPRTGRFQRESEALWFALRDHGIKLSYDSIQQNISPSGSTVQFVLTIPIAQAKLGDDDPAQVGRSETAVPARALRRYAPGPPTPEKAEGPRLPLHGALMASDLPQGDDTTGGED